MKYINELNKHISTKKIKDLKIHYVPGNDDLNGNCLLYSIQDPPKKIGQYQAPRKEKKRTPISHSIASKIILPNESEIDTAI